MYIANKCICLRTQERYKNYAKILEGRFILTAKQPEQIMKCKKQIKRVLHRLFSVFGCVDELFIMNGHKDKDKNLIIHTSRTVRLETILIVSGMAAMFPDYSSWLPYVTQAYIQRHELQRDIYGNPADHFKRRENTNLKFLNCSMGLNYSIFYKYKDFLKKENSVQTIDGNLSFHY